MAILYLNTSPCFSLEEPQGLTYARVPEVSDQQGRAIYIKNENAPEVRFQAQDLNLIEKVTCNPNRLTWKIYVKPEAIKHLPLPDQSDNWDQRSPLHMKTLERYIEKCKDLIGATFSAVDALRYTGILQEDMIDNRREYNLSKRGFYVPLYLDLEQHPEWKISMMETYEKEQLEYFGLQQGDPNLAGKFKPLETLQTPRIMIVDIKNVQAVLNIGGRLREAYLNDASLKKYIVHRVNRTFRETLGFTVIGEE